MTATVLPDALDVAALLDLLPALEEGDSSVEAPELVSWLVHLLYERHLVLWGFRWMEWEEGRRFVEDPGALATADLETICKLLTAHARSDRFLDGHLEAIVESGHIAAILRRLRDLEQSGMGKAE